MAEQSSKLLAKDRGGFSYLVLGGGFATNRGMQKMAEPFGTGAVAFNSELSSDIPNPLRYATQASFVRLATQNGQAAVLPHSLGLQGWGVTQEQLKKEGAFNAREDAEKLTVIAASPVGLFRGAKERAAFIVNYLRLMGPTAKGIDAVTAFPPENVTDEQIEAFMGKWRQTDASISSISMPRQSRHREDLTDEGKEQRLSENDEQLVKAVKSKKARKVRKAIRRRGRIVGKDIQNIFDGRDEPSEKETPQKVSLKTMIKSARPVLGRMLRGTAEEDIRYLAQRGSRIVLAHSKYDRVASLKASVRLRDELAAEGKKVEVVIFDRFGHNGLALDQNAYADAVKGLLAKAA